MPQFQNQGHFLHCSRTLHIKPKDVMSQILSKNESNMIKEGPKLIFSTQIFRMFCKMQKKSSYPVDPEQT